MKPFQKGDRVTLTLAGIEAGRGGRAGIVTGLVTRQQTHPDYCNVRKDGSIRGVSYARRFWKLAQP